MNPKLEAVRQASEKICRLWQEILRLQDWDVEVVVVRRFDLCLDDSQATIQIFDKKRRAHIQLMTPGDFNEDELSGRQDLELSIVHELLHLYTHALIQAKGQELTEEQAVHAISVALVQAARCYQPN